MKKLLLMTIFACASFCTFAQAPATPATPPVDPNAPEIKWDAMSIDYGNVKKGDETNSKRFFKFTNTGKTPLIISSCHGSCGCTVPTCPTEPILPGKGGQIEVHYDINRPGPFTKTVSVSSNAKNANETLKISGTVIDEATPSTGAVTPAATPAVTPAKAVAATPAPAATPASAKVKATKGQKAAKAKATK